MKSSLKNVLVVDRFTQEAMITLQHHNFLNVKTADSKSFEETDLSEIEGMIIRSRCRIDAEILKRAPRMQVIVTATSGFDHIDLEETKKWGITVMHTPEANVVSASEHTWHLILAAHRKFAKFDSAITLGDWRREILVGTELNGKTLGVIGLGRIGKSVARIASAFGMNVVSYDPYIEDLEFKQANVSRVSYEELLKHSDVISFHVPKTKLTYKMLKRSQLEFINRGSVVINCSRGDVIDEADLLEALEKGWVSVAGLDVFEKEPIQKGSRIHEFKNKYPDKLILTPHVGAQTSEAFAKSSQSAAFKLVQFFLDGTTTDSLPPKVAWYQQPLPWI